jgi:hypothetical protein
MLLVSRRVHAALGDGGDLELRFQPHSIIGGSGKLIGELLKGSLQVCVGLQFDWGRAVQRFRDLTAVE